MLYFNRIRQYIGTWVAAHLRTAIFLFAVAAVYGFYPYGMQDAPVFITAWRIVVAVLFFLVLISPLKREQPEGDAPVRESAGEESGEPEPVREDAFARDRRELEMIRELSDQFYVKSRKDTEKDFTLFLRKILTIIKKTFAAKTAAIFLINQHTNEALLKSAVSDDTNFQAGGRFSPDEGIIGEVLDANASQLKNGIEDAAALLLYYTEPHAAESALAAPITVGDEIIGILSIDSAETRAYNEDDIQLVETYAGVIAEIIVNFNNLFEFENSARLFSSFYEVSRGLNSNLKFDEVLDLLLEIVEKVFHYDRITIVRFEGGSDQAEIIKVRGQEDDLPVGTKFPLTEGLNGWLMRKRKPLRVADMEKGEYFMPRYSSGEKTNYGLRSFLGAPISYHDFCFGAISIENRKPNFYKERHERILVMLANNFGVALERSYVLEQLEELATTDGLTKLYNYRSFTQRLAEEIERANRYGVKFSLLILDIDFFKKVNDTFGHLAGDRVLKQIAEVIRKSTRGIDFIARYGGEEFAVILIETNIDESMISAERIRRNIEALETQYNGETINVTVSIGAVEYSENYPDPQSVIDRADQALYRAKQNGRNRIETHTEEREPVSGNR